MKSILLASVASVAFAGVAAAEVTFGGSAKVGYNDTDHNLYTGIPAPTSDNNFGFYLDGDISVTMSQELDNGLTAAASFNIDIGNLATSSALGNATDWVLSLSSDTAGLYIGDTAFAAGKHWVSAGDMEQDGFSANDGEVVIRGDVAFGAVNASVSYALTDAAGVSVRTANGTDVDQLSIGADATFGNISVALAYQEAAETVFGLAANAANGDYNVNEKFGISASTTFAGADVTLAYAKDNTTGDSSTGIKVGYPVGPVKLTAYYVDESSGAANWGINAAYANGPISVALDYQDDQGTQKINLDGSYDVGNGVMVLAGYSTTAGWDDSYYVAGTYDLGGGASLLMSYAAGGSDDDAYGPNDYQEGITTEVSFSF